MLSFSPEEKSSESWTNENMPFDYNTNVEEQIENIIKGFGNKNFFDSCT